MTLKEVMTVLASNNTGLNRKQLYLMLFEPDQQDTSDQKVKNIFYNRPLDTVIYVRLCSDDGFLLLSQRIHEQYFRTTGNFRLIYNCLSHLVQADPHLPEKYKADLLSFCNPDETESLSRFIALCLLCANNNTNQEKNGFSAGTGRDYGVNIHTYIRQLPTPLEHRLWKASQQALLRSRRDGNRFSSFDVIQSLLPKGYTAVTRFDARGTVDGGIPQKVMDICHNTIEHIAVVGDGGIGKTTFLHQIMLDEYMEKACGNDDKYHPATFKSGRPIPFFIELNRCPENIREWYDDTLQKTNFITRYIGQLFEGHLSLNEVKNESLVSIEKEFQRTPEDGNPRYLLLLDGFNEVRSSEGHSIRSALSNEISVLSSYPNVRIITTSRETQAAYFAASFKNVHLIGLEDDDILTYLYDCGTNVTKTGLIKANRGLMECLRIPLNLCMFSVEKEQEQLPETQGEIFYNFFHRNSSFYNIRKRADDTRTNAMDGYQTAFILDFILPFIGWSLENRDTFSADNRAVGTMIDESVTLMETFCSTLESLPYRDFGYDPSLLLRTIKSFRQLGENMKQLILDCIHGYLGILYLRQTDSGSFAERNRYLFCHHQFRDYFSAIWDIQMLALLPCISLRPQLNPLPENGCRNTVEEYVNRAFWGSSKISLVSQILMEHRNRPAIEEESGRWVLPTPATDEQLILKNALDFCRQLAKTGTDSHFLLQNILSSIVAGRGELSGEDLSDLDFRSCNFFNIRCSRKGRANTLAADFRNCHLYEECFEPEGHRDLIIEFLYRGHLCYTIDRAGCIKGWDVISGKMEFDRKGDDPCGLYDHSPSGFLRISPDHMWLAAKIQNSTPEGMETGVNLMKLDVQGYVAASRRISLAPGKHNSLDAIYFTDDSKAVLLLCDKFIIYCYGLEDGVLLYSRKYDVLVEGTILYSPNSESPILAFTGDYNPLEWTDWYTETYLEEEDDPDTDVTEEGPSITCHIYELACDSSHARELYCFLGMAGTTPTAEYIPSLSGFLLFNYGSMQIEFFDCTDGSVTGMFPDIVQANDMPPAHFHPHEERPGECYIMYPDTCYLVDLKHPGNSGIIMKYFIDGVAKLLPEGNAVDELYFKTSVAPVNGHFIVTNDNFIYEWDSENDLLPPRYNVAYYEVSDLICDNRNDEFILVHQNNGLSVFGGNDIALKDSITFREEGYNLTISCLESESRLLALTFSRPDHEKILLLDLLSGGQKTCFSTHEPSETILSASFSGDGKFLLIVTQYSCHEYEMSGDRLWHIASAADGERCVGGNYLGNEIEMAVVPHYRKNEAAVLSRCIRYKRKPYKGDIHYTLLDYYILPELSGDMYRGFVFQSYDYGVQGTSDENGMQDFWVTRGFFYPPEKDILDFDLPVLEYFSADGHPKRVNGKISPFQMIYFRHSHALRQRYKQYESGSYVSYIYLDEDTGQAVFMENLQNLFYSPDFRNTGYKEIWKEYEKGIGNYNGAASWSYIIPWSGNRLVCCYENFQLAVLDAETGEELELVDYTPGIAVYGCDFRHAILEGELKDELRRNGGRV